jgi:hypothetical protein
MLERATRTGSGETVTVSKDDDGEIEISVSRSIGSALGDVTVTERITAPLTQSEAETIAHDLAELVATAPSRTNALYA